MLAPELAGHEEQFMEAVLAVGVKSIRTFFGSSWRPREIRLRHLPAGSGSRLSEFFRAPVVPSAGAYSIRLAAADLSLRRPTRHDDTAGAIIKEFLDERKRRPVDALPAQVGRLVVRRLRNGDDATLTAIASVLAMSDRTLQRRLRDAGTDFATVLADARAEIVVAFLADAARPVGRLTELLGYSGPSAVSRFVRLRFGCDTRELRGRLLDPARVSRRPATAE